MIFKRLSIFKGVFLILILCSSYVIAGCRHKKHPPSHHNEVNITKLKKYKTILSYKKGTLGNPAILRYGETHLFVYDAQKMQVLELDTSGGKVRNTYGRRGRGPGEFLHVNNIFLAGNNLYVVDQSQFKISRFDLNGHLKSAFSYGPKNRRALPPAPPTPATPTAKNIKNQPVVTLQGKVLLPNARKDISSGSLYTLFNWDGDSLAAIGQIPQQSTFMKDINHFKKAIENHTIPDYYKSRTFVVNDRVSTGELYVIYIALPKIIKYTTAGKKRLERDIPATPELNAVRNAFFRGIKIRGHITFGRVLRNYVAGTSGKNGHLYLSLGKYYNMDSKNMWIHEFNAKGKLIRRYKLVSADVKLTAVFDIDFKNRRIFVVTKRADILAYPF